MVFDLHALKVVSCAEPTPETARAASGPTDVCPSVTAGSRPHAGLGLSHCGREGRFPTGGQRGASCLPEQPRSGLLWPCGQHVMGGAGSLRSAPLGPHEPPPWGGTTWSLGIEHMLLVSSENEAVIASPQSARRTPTQYNPWAEVRQLLRFWAPLGRQELSALLQPPHPGQLLPGAG